MVCNTNPLCRVFDYDAVISQQCRLFQGHTDTLGIPSYLHPDRIPSSEVLKSHPLSLLSIVNHAHQCVIRVVI